MAVLDLSPIMVAGMRFLIGGLFILIVCRDKRSIVELIRNEYKWIVFLGIMEFLLTYILYLYALTFAPASHIAALTLLTPIFVVVLQMCTQKLKADRWHVLAMTLSFLATIILFANAYYNNSTFQYDYLMGYMLIIAANLSFAITIVFIYQNKQLANPRMIGISQLFAGVCLIPFMGSIHLDNIFHMPVRAFILILYLSIVSTGLGFYLWNKGVSRIGSCRASMIGNLKAPGAAILSFILLGEAMHMPLLISMILLIFAVIIIEKRKCNL